jgi:CubicO group peptidase (beta-lactamase class C family)
MSRMEETVASYVANGSFMGSVLVARGEKMLLNKGYGFANLEWNIPNAPDTKFRLASISKQFTAACILLLEERGRLTLEDPIKKHMPEAPAAWDKITIHHLLTHTSGIPSFTSFPDYEAKKRTPATPEQLVAWFRDKPLDFQPGEKFDYSNSNYALLGWLIEKISGRRYAEFVKENVLDVLGMKDAGYDAANAILPRRAAGYAPKETGRVNAEFIDMSVPFAAGGLYATTEDLLRWERGLMGGKLLSPASLGKMTTPKDGKSGYALGVQVRDSNGRKIIEHAGGIEGFNTQLAYYPDERLSVIVLANLNGGAAGEIATRLGAIAHGEKVTLISERREVPLAPAALSAFVGDYGLNQMATIAIRSEEGQLTIQLTGQPKFPMFAESETRFFLKVVDAQIDFIKNEKGETTELVLHQNGATLKARRK